MADPIVPLVVVGTALLFGGAAAKAAKKKKAAAKKKAAEKNGNGKKHDLPDVDPSDDPDERCPEGWFVDDDNNVICQPVSEDPADVDVEPTDIYWSEDCQTIIEGDEWFEDVLVPVVLQWLDYDLRSFGSLPHLMRHLFTVESEGGVPFAEPACIADWPPIAAIVLDVPGGPWDYESESGFDAWVQATEDYVAAFPAMDEWLYSIEQRLYENPEVGVLLLEWHELYSEDFVFDPPCGGDNEIAC